MDSFFTSPLSVGKLFPSSSPFSAKTFENIFDKASPQFQQLFDQENSFLLSPMMPSPQVMNLSTSQVEIAKLPVPLLKPIPQKKDKKSTKKSKVEPTKSLESLPVQATPQNIRSWHVTSAHQTLHDNLAVHITNKTRCEEPSTIIPDILYSSLKYEIRMSISGNFQNAQFILGRISLIDQEGTIESGTQMLKGLIECALTRNEQGFYEGTFKSQFVDCSYHHKKGDFCWQIQYFYPSDLDHCILAVNSAPFKVFARKPTKEKRKTSTMDDFQAKLEELVKASKKLKTEEKKVALELVNQKFIKLDPKFPMPSFKSE